MLESKPSSIGFSPISAARSGAITPTELRRNWLTRYSAASVVTTAMAMADSGLTTLRRRAPFSMLIGRPSRQVRDIHEKLALPACPARPGHDNRKTTAHIRDA